MNEPDRYWEDLKGKHQAIREEACREGGIIRPSHVLILFEGVREGVRLPNAVIVVTRRPEPEITLTRKNGLWNLDQDQKCAIDTLDKLKIPVLFLLRDGEERHTVSLDKVSILSREVSNYPRLGTRTIYSFRWPR